ncbi:MULTISPECIES: non-homologous end-joining DNA ligase [Brevibacterium]|uniref:DNA ligase D polymerase domain-containing protein n=2 Tax=Brevibacterium casei TaxID=33889 RepID=K9AP26_9MICO|nr:non-homologous end-joining DNA ligase [Brevibacterium casei]SII98401.1 DNA polymerase LigD, polymerase domain protein [Mycobacteroides abscessus subsp. abscessus]EKU49163.1 hypothetical protein C272_00465 [Brevibacterium casei S18]KZE18463.1 DNA ligase [Brevibacterium casei]MBE4695785.1 DNA ligase [Brevibacterium casei]MBY3578907.1 DNA ligase [Brevibacterium casei]
MGETVRIAQVRIDHADKVLFGPDGPPVTKADLARYCADIAVAMLPHTRGRPISMERFPHGIDGESFFEKRAPAYFPDFVHRVRVDVETEHRSQDQVAIDNTQTLVYLADQACLTPHTWLSTAADLERPDQLIVDLDPTVPGLEAVRRATTMVGQLCAELGLTAFVKTTGSRGYHVMIPLRPDHDFDVVRDFAHRFAEVLVARDRDLLTTAARKAKRGDRVYLDVARNAYAQTAVPPFAVRARPGAPVSMPITWDEVDTVAPQEFTIASAARRLKTHGDPWAGIARHRQGLSRAMERLERLSGT